MSNGLNGPGTRDVGRVRGRDQRQACDHCGAELLAEQIICAKCGLRRRQPRKVRCRTCGTVNSPGQDECRTCGAPLRRDWMRPVLIAVAIMMGVLLVVLAVTSLRDGLDWIRLPVALSTQPPLGTEAPSSVEATIPSHTSLPSITPVPSQTPTPTPVPSLTPTQTKVPTLVPSITPTPTRTPTVTYTPSSTPSSTPAPTNTPRATLSPTSAPTSTPTPTPSPTSAPTNTPTATPTRTPAVASPATPTPFIYVVKAGDNLYNIALEFGTTVDAIMEANGLESNRLRVGQQLIIPMGTTTPQPAPTLTPTPTSAQP